MEPSAAPETNTQSPPPAFNPGRIENYYDQVHKASWVRRAAGIFAGATLGIIFGAAIGLIAACIPFILSTLGVGTALGMSIAPGTLALLTPAIALKSAAIYATIGGFMGPAVATDVGSSAGAVAGGLAVREHQELQAKAQEPVIAAQPTKDAGPSGSKYFSWRPGLFFTGVCGAFGAMAQLAANGAGLTLANGGAPLLSANTLLFAGVAGVTMTGTAAVIATAAVFALFGALFGFKFGRFSNNLSNFYTKILTDEFWNKKKQPSPALEEQQNISTERSIPLAKQAALSTTLETEFPGESLPNRRYATEPKLLTPETLVATREIAREQQDRLR